MPRKGGNRVNFERREHGHISKYQAWLEISPEIAKLRKLEDVCLILLSAITVVEDEKQI